MALVFGAAFTEWPVAPKAYIQRTNTLCHRHATVTPHISLYFTMLKVTRNIWNVAKNKITGWKHPMPKQLNKRKLNEIYITWGKKQTQGNAVKIVLITGIW